MDFTRRVFKELCSMDHIAKQYLLSSHGHEFFHFLGKNSDMTLFALS